MSEPYQIFTLITDPITGEGAVYGTHTIFKNLGADIDEDSLLILNETETEEPDPEYIEEPKTALKILSTWPTYGSIVYYQLEINLCLTVSFKGISYKDRVQSMKISLMQRQFERGGDNAKNFCFELAKKLHDKFQAKRTIMDWGLEYKGFDWEAELKELETENFQGQYSLIDIQRKNLQLMSSV